MSIHSGGQVLNQIFAELDFLVNPPPPAPGPEVIIVEQPAEDAEKLDYPKLHRWFQTSRPAALDLFSVAGSLKHSTPTKSQAVLTFVTNKMRQKLLYATGGLAYGRIEVDSSASATGVPEGLAPPCNGTLGLNTTCPLQNFSGSGVTKIGWTAGAGAELALGGNWTAKFEYLFVDLGSFDTTFTGFRGCFGTAVSCTDTLASTGTIHSRITDNIVRVGLNYQFH